MHPYMPGSMPLKDQVRIDAAIKQMREARREVQGGKNHLCVARLALDEIMRTKEYAFGMTLFSELMDHFTDVRDELGEMREMIGERI